MWGVRVPNLLFCLPLCQSPKPRLGRASSLIVTCPEEFDARARGPESCAWSGDDPFSRELEGHTPERREDGHVWVRAPK